MAMQFLLQSDPVTVVEKRGVSHAAMLNDSILYKLSLDELNALSLRDIPLEACPVGTVEFCLEVMRLRGVKSPAHLSYPEALKPFLHRRIWEGVFADTFAGALGDDPENIFAKPRHGIKKFTGALLKDLDIDPVEDNFPMYFSERVKFVSEWRYYIINDTIIGEGRYDDGEDDAPIPDRRIVDKAVYAMMLSKDRPLAYALDFGVLSDGQTALVEANDAWALGYYKGSCSHIDYATLLHNRWIEILYSHLCPEDWT